MPDVTLFEADLSGSTFVAPFGHYYEEGRPDPDDEDGGRNPELLAVLGLLAAAAVGAVVLFARRKLGGDGEDDATAEDWDDSGTEFEFENDQNGGYEAEIGETGSGADTDGRSTGAVAALIGLAFLLLVTALVKLRREESDEAAAFTPAEREEAPTAAGER